MPDRPLPHVSVATFCDRIMQEKDNVYSLIRLIDTISINATEDALPQASLNLTAFILLKSDARSAPTAFKSFQGHHRGAS
jgi:hypothetical protein